VALLVEAFSNSLPSKVAMIKTPSRISGLTIENTIGLKIDNIGMGKTK